MFLLLLLSIHDITFLSGSDRPEVFYLTAFWKITQNSLKSTKTLVMASFLSKIAGLEVAYSNPRQTCKVKPFMTIKAVDYFRKMLHFRCLTGFGIRLCLDLQLYSKTTARQVLSCKFCKIFWNSSFIKLLWTVASVCLYSYF